MRAVWAPEAKQDRLDIWDYIAAQNQVAAKRIDTLFSAAADRLQEHPFMGKIGRVPRTRELIIHEHYCLIYEVERETIWIVVLVHTARQWPPA